MTTLVTKDSFQEETMAEFRCADVGAFCKGHFTASTKEELMRIIATHLKKDHAVKTPTETIMRYIAKMSR